MSEQKTIPILQPNDTPSWLAQSRRPYHDDMFAMYSSEFGGIVTDPLFMTVPIDDHLVHRGDGVFETLRCIEGRIYCFHEHLDRLFTSAEKIRLTPPWRKEEIGQVVCASIQAADKRDCLVRLILSRGPGSMGISPDDSPKPNLYVLVHRALPPFMEKHPEGARIVICKSIPVKPGVYATIKSCNYLSNAMLKKAAADSAVDFAITLDENGSIAEGATENIGMISSDGVLTIPKPDRILSGTTMNRVFDLAAKGVKDGWLKDRQRSDISYRDLVTAREVFIFGTTTDVTAVIEVDQKPIGTGTPGPVYKKLSALLLNEQKSANEHTVAAFS